MNAKTLKDDQSPVSSETWLALKVEQGSCVEPKAGDRCPQCKTGQLDYDGMLNLVCSNSDYVSAGSFT